MVIQKNKQSLILTMGYGNILFIQLKRWLCFPPLLEIYCDSFDISWNNQFKLVFLFIINKNVNFERISRTKQIINSFNDKLIVECIRKLVRKSHTPVVPIANTCSIGYPHDGRADNARQGNRYPNVKNV